MKKENKLYCVKITDEYDFTIGIKHIYTDDINGVHDKYEDSRKRGLIGDYDLFEVKEHLYPDHAYLDGFDCKERRFVKKGDIVRASDRVEKWDITPHKEYEVLEVLNFEAIVIENDKGERANFYSDLYFY